MKEERVVGEEVAKENLKRGLMWEKGGGPRNHKSKFKKQKIMDAYREFVLAFGGAD